MATLFARSRFDVGSRSSVFSPCFQAYVTREPFTAAWDKRFLFCKTSSGGKGRRQGRVLTLVQGDIPWWIRTAHTHPVTHLYLPTHTCNLPTIRALSIHNLHPSAHCTPTHPSSHTTQNIGYTSSPPVYPSTHPSPGIFILSCKYLSSRSLSTHHSLSTDSPDKISMNTFYVLGPVQSTGVRGSQDTVPVLRRPMEQP